MPNRRSASRRSASPPASAMPWALANSRPLPGASPRLSKAPPPAQRAESGRLRGQGAKAPGGGAPGARDRFGGTSRRLVRAGPGQIELCPIIYVVPAKARIQYVADSIVYGIPCPEGDTPRGGQTAAPRPGIFVSRRRVLPDGSSSRRNMAHSFKLPRAGARAGPSHRSGSLFSYRMRAKPVLSPALSRGRPLCASDALVMEKLRCRVCPGCEF